MANKYTGKPELADGYLRIANELFCAITLAHFKTGEYPIILEIIRRTYGFNKKIDVISISQISEYTGMKRQHVCRSLTGLIDCCVVIAGGTRTKRTLQLNKYYTKWLLSDSVMYSLNRLYNDQSGAISEPESSGADHDATRSGVPSLVTPESQNDHKVNDTGVPSLVTPDPTGVPSLVTPESQNDHKVNDTGVPSLVTPEADTGVPSLVTPEGADSGVRCAEIGYSGVPSLVTTKDIKTGKSLKDKQKTSLDLRPCRVLNQNQHEARTVLTGNKGEKENFEKPEKKRREGKKMDKTETNENQTGAARVDQDAPYFPSWLNRDLFDRYVNSRNALGEPMTPSDQKTSIDRLCRLIANGADQDEIINKAIAATERDAATASTGEGVATRPASAAPDDASETGEAGG